jgi:hypothetical protein
MKSSLAASFAQCLKKQINMDVVSLENYLREAKVKVF